MKKRLIALFVLVLIVAGICFLNKDGSKVQATGTVEMYTENDDFISVYYSEINHYRGATYIQPDSPAGYEDYLFAGWYSAQECEKDDALTSSTKSGEAWAKYVPADVLSVKAQIALNSNDKYNMRIISTIDTLNYGAVGFNVAYNGKSIPIPIKEVYTRIKATAESGVDYNYSPKIVDTKSEYFMTATLANIGSDRTGVVFDIIPYWRTLDGTMVNGVNRYVTVDDGIVNGDETVGNEIFSFNVKAQAINNWEDMAVTGVDAANVSYRHNGSDDYVSVIVSGQNESTLSSVTKYVITGAEDETINVIHRNYNTTHETDSNTANADKTWYTVVNEVAEANGTTVNEYVIATSADLYGVSTQANKDTFDGKTIYVVNDITVNENDVTTSAGTYVWDPIGSGDYKFSGVFDAQMHTISGLYVSSESDCVGLFAWLRDSGSAVKKLRLKNSYFYGSAGVVGAIAGRSGGTIDTIYSEAIVIGDNCNRIGGIVGEINKVSGDTDTTQAKINNCWVANDTIVENKQSYCWLGGIVGYAQNLRLEMTNCFVEGDVIVRYSSPLSQSTNLRAGGFCGASANTTSVIIEDCLLAGNVQALYGDETKGYTSDSNAVISLYDGENAGNLTITRVFAKTSTTSTVKGSGGSTWNGHWTGTKEAISGTDAYTIVANKNNGKLDFYTSNNTDGEWIIRENNVPALKSFVNDGIDVAWYYDNEDSDIFTISTEEELYGLSALSADMTFAGKTINLGADIKVNNGIASEWAAGTKDADREWTRIGRTSTTPFEGTFNGRGHTIQGIYLNGGAESGLFGWTNSALVKNFKLSNSCFSTSSDYSLGSIAGKGDGTFLNIYCDDSVILNTTKSTCIGGIIGTVERISSSDTSNCTVVNCWFDGTIKQQVTNLSSSVYTGGIVGYQLRGTATIDNCLYTGELDINASFSTQKYFRVGGFLGGKNAAGTASLAMSNCLSDGAINHTANNASAVQVGAVFGGTSQKPDGETYSNIYAAKNDESVTKALWIAPASSSTTYDPNEITFVSRDQLYAKAAADLEYTYHWESFENDTPKLRYYLGSVPENCEWYIESIGDETDPYMISTAGELDSVATMTNLGNSFANKNIKLANNIEYNKGTKGLETVAEWDKAKANLKEWTPIGTATATNKYEKAFTGTFDGNEKTISGIYIADGSMIGLFGVTTSDAVIKDIAVTDSYITGSGSYVGSIIGKGGATLTNVYSDALINSTGINIGGLVGYSQVSSKNDTELSMTGCWFDGKIHVENDAKMQVGGMVGYLIFGAVSLDNCIYSGEINCISTASVSTQLRVGGLVGVINSSSGISSASVTNSLSAGKITTTSTEGITLTQIGSIVGNTFMTLPIENVYTTLDSYNKVVGSGNISGDAIISVEEESMYGATPCSFEGLDFESTWVPRKGTTPGLQSFATNDYEGKGYVVADRTWVNDNAGTEGDPYIIKDAADLLGLSMLSLEGNTFEGKTIKVADGVTELDLNSNWTAGAEVADIFWNPVGSETYKFNGTFDGNNVIIKGIYNNSDKTTYVGLFGYVGENAILKNIRLQNSCFEQNTGENAYVGSVAAVMRGTSLENVYSNALINSNSQHTGGLIALADSAVNKLSSETDSEGNITTTYDRGTISIQNAWYDGAMKVSFKAEQNYRYIGGIIAVVNQGTINMDNILFTGSIDTNDESIKKRAYAGGIVGIVNGQTLKSVSDSMVEVYQEGDETTINLNSCISAGKISQPTSMVGSVIGRAEYKYTTTDTESFAGNTYVNLQNVFATRECHNLITNVDSKTTTTDGVTTVLAQGVIQGSEIVQSQYNSDRLIGYCVETGTDTKLDFTSENPTWLIRQEGTPVPSTFADIVLAVEVAEDATLDETLTAESGLDYWGAEPTLEDAVHSGQGNYLLNYTETAEKTYEGFIQYLEGKEFTERVTNSGSTMAEDGVHNVTYIKGTWVINITHIDNLGTVDVLINTFGTEESLLSPNLFKEQVTQTEEGTEVKMSMLEMQLVDNKDTYGNSFVFQLPNGHFIIVDGGNNTDDAQKLLTYLKETVGKEGDTQKPVIIDAWIISHFHADHCGALIRMNRSTMVDYIKDVYLNAVYINEPNNYAKLVDEKNQTDEVNEALSSAMVFTKSPETSERPDIYRVHTGERYYFDGLIMDIVLTQEQIDPHIEIDTDLSITNDSIGKPYRYYGDRDAFNATSTSCIFTVNKTNDKIFVGGDSNRANMNYIMKAYDGSSAFTCVVQEEGTDETVGKYKRWTEKTVGEISKTESETLKDISVFTALHHGKNTSDGFTKYLFGTTDSNDDELEVVLFPYYQMYSATYKASHTGDDGQNYSGRYWMEDGSSVFEYQIEKYNQELCASADNRYYTYGYEDSISETIENRHGTVELIFATNGINANILKTWHVGFTMDAFQ